MNQQLNKMSEEELKQYDKERVAMLAACLFDEENIFEDEDLLVSGHLQPRDI